METYPFQSPWELPRSIFLVDDEPDSAFLLKRDLQRAFPAAEIREMPSCAALRLITLDAPDLLVSAYRLQGITGAEFISQIRHAGGCFPIVIVSSMSLYRAKALEAGAHLFLPFEEVKQIGSHLRALEETRGPWKRTSSLDTSGLPPRDTARPEVEKPGLPTQHLKA